MKVSNIILLILFSLTKHSCDEGLEKYSCFGKYDKECSQNDFRIDNLHSRNQKLFSNVKTIKEVEYKIVDRNPKYYNHFISDYNKNGYLISQTQIKEDSVLSKIIYKYDNENRLVEQVNYFGSDTISYSGKQVFQYNGNTRRSSLFNSKNQVIAKTTEEFNSKGYKTKHIIEYLNIKTDTTYYEYDQIGKLKRQWKNKKDDVKYLYDTNHNRIGIVNMFSQDTTLFNQSFDKYGNQKGINENFIYDNEKNWIKKMIVLNNNKILKTERIIEYY